MMAYVIAFLLAISASSTTIAGVFVFCASSSDTAIPSLSLSSSCSTCDFSSVTAAIGASSVADH